jgi:hypothetical protein
MELNLLMLNIHKQRRFATKKIGEAFVNQTSTLCLGFDHNVQWFVDPHILIDLQNLKHLISKIDTNMD